MRTELVVVLSAVDPVAAGVAREWGDLPSEGSHVDGAALRRLTPSTLTLGRLGLHVEDDDLDQRLPRALVEDRPTLVFPSIHRSGRNIPALTVHPLGNLGPRADVGGRPRTVAPADPRRMTNALRLLVERGRAADLSATFESTHHGPSVGLPAFFIEIGYGELPVPPAAAVRALADVIPTIRDDSTDRVAMGVGGGHYAPHFTDLALHRSWAFGHILSRHSVAEVDRRTVSDAFAQTPGAEGIVFARAEDARHPAIEGLAPRLRDQDAPSRPDGRREGPTGASRSASGT